MEAVWTELSSIVQQTTGRKLVGTPGGLYAFTDSELRVPYGSVEGVIHELCHFAVSNDTEKKQLNLGLSTDWQHPGYDRMVKCEELAWSLEFYLFGDPAVERMASFLTPEARASGGGGYVTYYTKAEQEERDRLQKAYRVEQAAIAELTRAMRTVLRGELRPDGSEELRREALAKAEQAGLPVKRIKALIKELEQEEERRVEQEKAEYQRKRARAKERRAEARKERAERRLLTKPCEETHLGEMCERIGPHTEHRILDVMGSVVLSWGTPDAVPVRREAEQRSALRAPKKRCRAYKHVHCGVARRETDADQCGEPISGGEGRSYWFGWCGCRVTETEEY